LCGTGIDASANTCNKGCDTSKGSCSTFFSKRVVKYTCDGRKTECRDNESAFASSQSVSGSTCGKTVQIDVFKRNCRANDGSWRCGEGDLVDYMVWYSGDCTTTPPQNTCQAEQPTAIRFRKSGTATWSTGDEVTASITGPTSIDVNCFARNGSALLPGGYIEVQQANQAVKKVSSTSELRNYSLLSYNMYTFTCKSTSLPQCSNTDSVTVIRDDFPGPRPTNQPQPHTSSCDDLDVVGGNNSLVPAKVTLRAAASDSRGPIRAYRFYFGDGTSQDSNAVEVQHTYETSGNFIARVDVKDSQGNWKTSNSCETNVTVKSLPVESHKADCSDLFITADNGAKAPSLVKFDINGFDNKGSIQGYKLDTDDNYVGESDQDKFEHRYERPGTYTIRAYIKDSKGNWQGGDGSCRKTLYINTKPLTNQPSTGTETWFTLIGLGGTVTGSSWFALRKKLLG
jgi:hypothetical protein